MTDKIRADDSDGTSNGVIKGDHISAHYPGWMLAELERH
jgi:hypothetical protein